MTTAPAVAAKAPPTDTGRCGGTAGHRRHVKRGERPCEPCRDARNVYQQQRRSGQIHLRLPADGAIPLPPWVHPYAGRDVMHHFKPLSVSQCAGCFGWRDDPRHL